jgi:hypothetical protein
MSPISVSCLRHLVVGARDSYVLGRGVNQVVAGGGGHRFLCKAGGLGVAWGFRV